MFGFGWELSEGGRIAEGRRVVHGEDERNAIEEGMGYQEDVTEKCFRFVVCDAVTIYSQKRTSQQQGILT